MATEPTRIPIRQVSKEITNVGPDALILVDDGVSMGRAKASDAIDKRAKTVVEQEIDDLNLGTAAQSDVEDFATSAQGSLADSAVQPDDLASVATSGSYDDLNDKPPLGSASEADVGDFATAAQGAKADAAVLFSPQVLSLSQGLQAQANIGAPGTVNFYMFGAVPDSDDPAVMAANSAAMQAAFDSGHPIYQPDGRIFFNQQIHIKGASVFSGSSREGNKLVWMGTGHAFRFDNPSDFPYGDPRNGCQFFLWEKFWLDMSITNNQPAFNFRQLIQFGKFRDFDIEWKYKNNGATPSDDLMRRAFDFTDDSGTPYKAYTTWENFKLHYADHGFYIPPGTPPVNALRIVNATFEGCLHCWHQLEAPNVGRGLHDFLNWGVQMAGDSRNQVAIDNLIGVNIRGGWWETKTGLDEFIPGDYSTANFIHGGPGCEGLMVDIPRFVGGQQSRAVMIEGIRSRAYSWGVERGSKILTNNYSQVNTANRSYLKIPGQNSNFVEYRNENDQILGGVTSGGVKFDSPVSLTISTSTLTIDASRNVWRYFLNTSITSVGINNLTVGQDLEILLISNGGSRTITGWPSFVRFAGDSFTATAVSGKGDLLRFRWDGVRLYEISRVLNISTS